MSRSLQIAHVPVLRPVLRFSGYVTDPSITDAMLQDRMRCFDGLTLWRSSRNLPPDWPVRDDSMITSPPPVVPAAQRVWGQGAYVCVDSYLGESQTPDTLLVGVGKLVFERVWLYDANAEPWPTGQPSPCPPPIPCPPCEITPPTKCAGSSLTGAIVGAIVGAGGVGTAWWYFTRRRATEE